MPVDPNGEIILVTDEKPTVVEVLVPDSVERPHVMLFEKLAEYFSEYACDDVEVSAITVTYVPDNEAIVGQVLVRAPMEEL